MPPTSLLVSFVGILCEIAKMDQFSSSLKQEMKIFALDM